MVVDCKLRVNRPIYWCSVCQGLSIFKSSHGILLTYKQNTGVMLLIKFRRRVFFFHNIELHVEKRQTDRQIDDEKTCKSHNRL